MSKIKLKDLFEEPFSGEWGSPSTGNKNDFFIIRSTNIDKSCRIVLNDLVVRNISTDKAKKKALKSGDLLIEISGGSPDQPVGRAVIFTSPQGKYTCSNFINILKPKLENSPLYLYYQLLFCYESGKTLKHSQQTTGLINLKIHKYLEEEIQYFSPSQQRKIAEILASIDTAIEKTEGLIAKYQAVKQGMMNDLFTCGIDEHGQLRSSYQEAPHLYHETDIGWIPKNWVSTTVGDHLIEIEQGWSPDCDSDPALVGHWGVLKTTAVMWDGYNYKENKALPIHLNPKPKYAVDVGDVLMTRGGPNSRVGVVAYVYETQEKLMMSDKLYRLIPKASLISEYLALALSSNHAQIHLSTLKTGLAESQTNISQSIVRKLKIAKPNLVEQKKICAYIQGINTIICREFQGLKGLQSLKKGLMQDLLTGKVPVQVDESDAVLNTVEVLAHV